MSEAIRFDESRWPVLVIRFRGQPSDEEFIHYLDNYGTYLERPGRYAVVLVTEPNAPMTKVKHAKWQTQWIKDHFDRLAAKCAGIGFVLPSPVMRGVLRMIMARTDLPAPHTVGRSEAEVLDWASGMLAADRG